MPALLDIRPHGFKIDLPRPVRAVHAPQPALALTFPEQDNADRVLPDQRAQRPAPPPHTSQWRCRVCGGGPFAGSAEAVAGNVTITRLGLWIPGRYNFSRQS